MKLIFCQSCVILLIFISDFTSGKLKKGKQLSFALPGLSLFNGNGGSNLFGRGTTTRTVVRTVSTVTQGAYRTCTTTAAAFPPCAGRRRRELSENELDLAVDDELLEPEPTLEITLNVGNTRIVDPSAVSEYLKIHKPGPSVIYAVSDIELEATTNNAIQDARNFDLTTNLYSSFDDSVTQSLDDIEDDVIGTTEIPSSQDFVESENDDTATTPEGDIDHEKARVNFGSQVTTTTTISVTSVATTFITIPMSTLTITYGGCSPPSPLPVSGMACA